MAAALNTLHMALTWGFVLMVIPIGVVLIVGVVIGIVQAVTQLQDPSISFFPKALALGAVLFWVGPWLFTTYAHFVVHLWTGGMF